MPRTHNKQHVFQHKPADKTPLTSEAIAAHLAAFKSSGGHIEVLGNTPALKKSGPAADEASNTGGKPAAAPRRR